MTMTLFERSWQEGFLQGQRQFFLRQLSRRFGPLSPHLYEVVETWSEAQLAAVGEVVLYADSLQEIGLADIAP